jgi:cell division septation protein DedD
MKFKGSQKPSLVILVRTTLALMLLTIGAVGFGAGYLIGYRISSYEDRPVLQSESRMVLPPEEKRVLEPAPKQPQPEQQSQPSQAEQPIIGVKPSAPEAATAHPENKQPVAEQRDASRNTPIDARRSAKQQSSAAAQDAQDQGKQSASGEKKRLSTVAAAAPAQAADMPVKTEKKKKATKKHAVIEAKKGTYAVQFGAFEDPSRALQLKKELAAHGINAYIVPKGKSSSYARVRAGAFAKRMQAVQYAEMCQAKGFAGYVTK